MAAKRIRVLSALLTALTISGCSLCDRYCDRQQDRCRTYYNPNQNCYPAPNQCYPAPATSGYVQPVAQHAQPMPYCP